MLCITLPFTIGRFVKTIFPFVDPVIRDKPPAAAHYYIWGSKVWVASLLKADTRNVVITYLEELSDMVFFVEIRIFVLKFLIQNLPKKIYWLIGLFYQY